MDRKKRQTLPPYGSVGYIRVNRKLEGFGQSAVQQHHCRYRSIDIQRWLIRWLRLILISLDRAWKPFLFWISDESEPG
jgi:hypothetical protein